jgi:hypothetical protein
MLVLSIGAFVGTAFAGWVAGMWTHKRAQRWCPRCGLGLVCPDCTRLKSPHSSPTGDDAHLR